MVEGEKIVRPSREGRASHEVRATPGAAASAQLQVRIEKQFAAASPFELDVDFVAPACITILFGASGSGKTTILESVAGLLAPDRGRIVLNDRTLFDSAQKINIPAPKRHVGYVFQDLALFPHLTVRGNVEFGIQSLTRTEREQRVTPLLQAFRIGHLIDRRPAEISGGERQRVALARALVTDPEVLLLDEPLVGLDAAVKSSIVDDLRQWNQSHRIPILYITHSRAEVLALGDSVIVLDQGRVLAQGTPHEVLTVPVRETVAQLAGFENIFDATVDSIHEERGSMNCRLAKGVTLETPLVRAEVGSRLRVGIRAGDILLATQAPEGLSARNILQGRVTRLQQRDVIIETWVDCGIEFEVQMTLAARADLRLDVGSSVWLIIKTYSCHLMTA
jgi:molybdate transport system ATP-binding protein